ncbi:MAG: hypothetical protein PWP63_1566 [Methanolobus sp.]|nr:hypothetical protein [Methanolobus sp.]
MTNYSKRTIYALALFLIPFSCIGFAAENASYSNDSVRVNDLIGEDVTPIGIPGYEFNNISFTGWGNNEEVRRMWEEGQMKMCRIMELSNYGIENLTNPGSPIYDPAVLKTYGEFPPINKENPAPVYENKLRTIRDDSWQEISFYPSGPVIRYGSDPERYYFLIELYDDGRNGETYTEKDTRGIYDIVDKYAIQNGITDVPVVFILANETKIVEYINFPVYIYHIGDGVIEESTMPKQSTEIIELSAFQEGVNINKQAPALGVWESLLMILIVSFIWKRKEG